MSNSVQQEDAPLGRYWGPADNSGVTTKACLFLLVTFFGCANAILTSMSKNEANTYDYETITVPLFMELAKLAVTFSLLVHHNQPQPSVSEAARNLLKRIREALGWQYFALAILYALQNNLVFFTLQFLDPGTFHILGNLRIPVVAVMLFFILRKSYSKEQIAGLTLLTVGATLYSVGKYNATKASTSIQTSPRKGQQFGYGLAFLMILCAAIAGVFNEYCLKRSLKHQSVALQNFQLYLYGFILNLAALLVKQRLPILHIFRGYTMITSLIIINNAFFGVSVGYITKYCDNNVRSFAGIASMLLATGYSYTFMASPLPTGYQASLSLVVVGIVMYTQTCKL